jgi:hypothetical protein
MSYSIYLVILYIYIYNKYRDCVTFFFFKKRKIIASLVHGVCLNYKSLFMIQKIHGGSL